MSQDKIQLEMMHLLFIHKIIEYSVSHTQDTRRYDRYKSNIDSKNIIDSAHNSNLHYL